MVIVGIDFGSTRSYVAVSQCKMITVIENDQGARATPSCVSFTEGQRFVGESALQQLTRDPENTVYHIKEIIGHSYKAVTRNFDAWPIKVVNQHGRLNIQFRYKGRDETLLPEEIVSMIFSRLKEIAEAYLQHSPAKAWPNNLRQVTGAVITVPASFNALQRRAIKDAAKIAGLNVVGMINETVAAAIDFGLKTKPIQKKNVLVFHLGGGFFDVTILTIKNGVYKVKAHHWSADVGGDLFHRRMLNSVLKLLKNPADAESVRKNAKSFNKLRLACEKAKKDLCLSRKVSVKADALLNGQDFECSITMKSFEDMNQQLSDIMLDVIGVALSKAELKVKQIEDIVLVGGATRMPMIMDMLVKYGFQEDIFRKTVNSDEAAVQGAAAYAGVLSSNFRESEDIVISDLISHPLELKSEYGSETLVPCGSRIPLTQWRDLPGNFEVNYGAAKVAQNFTVGGVSREQHQDTSVGILFEIDAGGLFCTKSIKDGIARVLPIGMKTEEISHLRGRAVTWLNEERERKEMESRLHNVETDAYSLIDILRQHAGDKKTHTKTRKCEEILRRIAVSSLPDLKQLEQDERYLNEMHRKFPQTSRQRPKTPKAQPRNSRDKAQHCKSEPMEQDGNPDPTANLQAEAGSSDKKSKNGTQTTFEEVRVCTEQLRGQRALHSTDPLYLHRQGFQQHEE